MRITRRDLMRATHLPRGCGTENNLTNFAFSSGVMLAPALSRTQRLLAGSLSSPLAIVYSRPLRTLAVIGDNARSVASRATPFILGVLINNTFSVAFRADFPSHLCASPQSRRW
jgi:hypothetical protein